MLDTVKVDPDTFSSIVFMGSSERKEFTRDNRPRNEKPQKRNGEGVPVWSVQLACVSWRNVPQMVTVSIPAHDDPASKFSAGDPVQLSGLVFGVTPKREGGYVTWCAADALAPVSVPSGSRAAA
jgi:hypothetical protein